MIKSLLSKYAAAVMAVAITAGFQFQSQAAFDRRFDICTFCCPCQTTNHMCQSQFDALNWKTNAARPNGHMIMMGSDAHRSEINDNGNFLGVYYNVLNDNYPGYTATQKADDIENNYVIANFTSTGVKPTWILLNEISSAWATDATYRAWLIAMCTRLKNTYNHTVIICTFYDNPGTANATDWQSLSGVAYIAVESYLSGAAVNGSGNSVSWCQTQYSNSRNTWINNTGVASSKLFYGEEFPQTTTGNFGRSGVSSAGWDNAIKARADAAHNLAFPGYFSFGWSGNQMSVSDTELIQHENTWAAKTIP